MKCSPNAIKQAEYTRNIWCVSPEPGTAFEDMLKPEYWAHVAVRLRPHDRIEITADDGSYFAELIVLACAKLWAKVVVLRHVELASPVAKLEAVTAADAGYEIKWSGNTAKHRVTRLSDKVVLAEGLSTKKEAEDWLADHLKTLAA